MYYKKVHVIHCFPSSLSFLFPPSFPPSPPSLLPFVLSLSLWAVVRGICHYTWPNFLVNSSADNLNIFLYLHISAWNLLQCSPLMLAQHFQVGTMLVYCFYSAYFDCSVLEKFTSVSLLVRTASLFSFSLSSVNYGFDFLLLVYLLVTFSPLFFCLLFPDFRRLSFCISFFADVTNYL